MINKAIDPEEQKWQRRSDARTLAEAEQIKADRERYSGAQTGAKEILQEEKDRLLGLSKVAGKKTPKVPEEKSNVSPKTQMRARPSQKALPDGVPDCFRK